MSSSHSALQRLGNWFTLVLVIVAVSLVILEFVIHRHGEIALEDLPLFPAVYAFFVCILIVVGGIWLRKITMRPEDYYDDE